MDVCPLGDTLLPPARLALDIGAAGKLLHWPRSIHRGGKRRDVQEVIRRQYLEAMGIDQYIPRHPLPGAAPSPVILPMEERAPWEETAPQEVVPPASVSPQARPQSGVQPAPAPVPQARKPELPPDLRAAQAAEVPEARAPERPAHQEQAVRFSLATIFAGGIAWVELLDNRPLAREQVQLVSAITGALRGPGAAVEVSQFDWPTHNNPQLDRGPEAARAALGAFLGRHMEERELDALVLLGEACGHYVTLEPLPGLAIHRTCSTLEMLAEPARKRLVWRELRALSRRA